VIALIPTLMVLSGVLGGTVIVVCPGPWQQELAPWVQQRTAQGHRVVVLAYRGEAAAELAARVQARLRTTEGDRYVLLVGDAPPGLEEAGRDGAASGASMFPRRAVPMFYRRSRVVPGVKHIATDAPYGDLDGDDCPEVAVGRWSVSTREELRQVVRKTLAYGKRLSAVASRPAELVFWAGHGGFGPVTDRVIQLCTRRVLAGELPPECPVRVLPPHAAVSQGDSQQRSGQLPAGSVRFWVYMGHGFVRGLSPLPQRSWTAENLLGPHAPKPNGTLAVLLCCESGYLDHPLPCLAEQLLRHRAGPAAVLAGSRVTMPYGMAVLGRGLLRYHFAAESAAGESTLGRMFLAAQRRAFFRPDMPPDDALACVIDQAARWLNIHPHLKRERCEHVWLFNLLGDPTLPLPRLPRLKLKIPPRLAAGEEVTLQVRSPRPGRMRVQLFRPLEVPLERLRPSKDPDPAVQNKQRLAAAPGTAVEASPEKRRVLDRPLARKIAPGQENTWVPVRLRLPQLSSGRYELLLRVEGSRGAARGWASVEVTPAAEQAGSPAEEIVPN